METIDKELCKLFYNVLHNDLTDSLSLQNVKLMKKSLPDIRKKYKGGRIKESLVHSFPASNCVLSHQSSSAFFYECSMCLASSTAKTFLDLTKENFNFFQRKMLRKTIKISCIAGGMASEIVAVVKVLFNLMKEDEQSNMKFDVTFINADNNWDAVTVAVLEELRETVYGVKLTSRFVEYDPKYLSNDVLEVFHSTDILVATKFSQELSNIKDKEFNALLQVAFQHMKFDSLFCCVDFSTADFIKILDKEISKFNSFKSVYRNIYACHTLSLDSVESHLKHYSEHFEKDLSSSYYLSSVAAWLKCDNRRGSKLDAVTFKSHIPPYKVKRDKRRARSNVLKFSKSVENLYSQRKW